MKKNKTACHCKNVTYGMIEDAIKNGASSYEEVEKLLQERFSPENPEFSKQKSICEANSAWIFATYLEGTEQIQSQKDTCNDWNEKCIR